MPIPILALPSVPSLLHGLKLELGMPTKYTIVFICAVEAENGIVLLKSQSPGMLLVCQHFKPFLRGESYNILVI